MFSFYIVNGLLTRYFILIVRTNQGKTKVISETPKFPNGRESPQRRKVAKNSHGEECLKVTRYLK
jgi:hypothetical protein